MQRVPKGHDGRCCNEAIVKLRCHSCKCDSNIDQLVRCRNPGCGLFYCRRCLTSRYKYSRAKAANLPTLNWQCPVCCKRCYCDTCVSVGLTVPPVKVVNKIKATASNWYRKKRIRKSHGSKHKLSGPQEQNEMSSSTSRTTHLIRLDATQQSEQYTQSWGPRGQLPPITGTPHV